MSTNRLPIHSRCLTGLLLAAALCPGPGRIVLAEGAEESAHPPAPTWKHVRVDREGGFVEIETAVIRQKVVEGEWLELVACAAGGPEHESVLVTKARPSHVHLALLLLGLEPGTPMAWKLDGDRIVVAREASGPRLAVTAHYERDGEPVVEGVHGWIVNRRTERALADNIWLFTGSRFHEFDGRKSYLADMAGTILSLVQFGDEVLARPTKLTRENDDEAWTADRKRVPPKGTRVLLRLTPVPEAKPESAPSDAKPEANDE